MYEERKYRSLFKNNSLVFFEVMEYETDLCIGAKTNLKDIAQSKVIVLRKELIDYINKDSNFLNSLIPIEPLVAAPEIVIKMCRAAKKADVGPMAAVAGAVSELVGNELLKYSDEVLVENGGDIFLAAKTIKKVGVFAGKSKFSEKIALIVEPDQTPIGICTSSGTVGHSLSFGKADAVVILSKGTFLADAVATATGNRVKSVDDIEEALQFASSIHGVTGVLIIKDDKLAISGEVKITKL